MGPVARVIYNRLARGMPLQMDSTVLYALGQRRGHGHLGRPPDSTARTTPICTQGLTPTPTCFPSAGGAAGRPRTRRPGSWLYFVVVEPDGTEAFSDTFAGQQANEALAAQRGLG